MTAMDWTWSWVPYGTGAHFGENPVFDWVRVVCVVLGVMLAFAIGRVLVEQNRRVTPMPATQIARFAALAFADLSISMTEIAVVGTPATPRLILNILVVGTGFYGVHGMRRKQRRTPPVR